MMRNLTLADDVADAVYTAIKNSTDAGPPIANNWDHGPGPGPTPEPIPVSDMVPGHWSRAHILAAILNSGALSYSGPGSAGTLVNEALTAAAGSVYGVAKAISDTQGSKLATALSHMRTGVPAQEAYDRQKVGVGGNYTDPDFTIDELAAAWGLAQSYGVGPGTGRG